METKELTTKLGKWSVKRITFGEENSAIREAIKHCEITGESYDGVVKREFMLLKAIVEAPIKVNIEAVRNLDRNDSVPLTRVYNELNEVLEGE